MEPQRVTKAQMMGDITKVAIVEDQREIREGLGQLINATPNYRCTGIYASMEEALEKIPHNLPDLVLSDIGLPGMDGINGIRILKERYPELLILMLTVYDDNERIFDAICAGACGYLLKKTPWPKLVEALKEAVDGGSPMSPEVARRVITLFRQIKPPKESEYELTPHVIRGCFGSQLRYPNRRRFSHHHAFIHTPCSRLDMERIGT